ncbi:MAG: hypothetical protein P9L98_03250 [Candidatus Kaelpia imicola]|nr:hypothetical protein [Candidatus Kaelpia imicola]
MKGWTLRETLLTVLVLVLIFVFLMPKYIITTKRALAQEAVRTIYLMENVINSHYIQSGVFSFDLEELNLDRLNNIEGANFIYHITGSGINNYEILAYGEDNSAAEGIMVSYVFPDKSYYVEYLGKVITGKKVK